MLNTSSLVLSMNFSRKWRRCLCLTEGVIFFEQTSKKEQSVWKGMSEGFMVCVCNLTAQITKICTDHTAILRMVHSVVATVLSSSYDICTACKSRITQQG